MAKISVLILTNNSDRTLVRCLESVKEFDEIIVVDSGSNDLTENMTHSYMGQFIVNRFLGFSEQRNFSITKASHEWCLVVDSDECVTPELLKELYKIAEDKNALSLYRVFRTEYILGKETKTGHGKSGYQERFFKKAHVHYEGKIHEYPVIDGVKPSHDSPLVGNLPEEARLLHDPDNSITNSVSKLGTYSILKAREKMKSGKKISAFGVYFVFHLTFFQMLFKCIKEGRRGFMAALVEAMHRSLVKLLIYEKQVIDQEKNEFKKI
ncbi:MAG: glycosyltransferase family 2 protein [Bacteriovoracaceae bacterium]